MTRTPNYRQDPSQHAERLANFRKQMADFARGERLRELRDARHLSQEDAAHEIGVSVKTIRSWEKGSGIRWDNAKSAGNFYGVDPESLVAREPGGDGAEPLPGLSQLDRMEQQLDAILEWVEAQKVGELERDEVAAVERSTASDPPSEAEGSESPSSAEAS